MKLFLIVSLLGTALASPGGVAYSSYSTAYGPLARAALAYGGYSGAPLTALHGEGFLATGAAYSAAPVAGYAASAPVAGYAAAAPVASYAAAAPVAGYAAAAPVAGYAAAAPLAGYAAAAPVAGYAAAVPVTGYAAAAPLTSYSAATHVVASAPAVAAAPVATYAAAPVAAVAHAPAAAVVPVTRVSAQPAVVQNVVDVAQPKLATRRFEIRRPAIQKEFYDVEERVVVRPAGSAVVELETPIGANQRGPTKISPAAPPVALHSYTSTHLGASVGPTVLPHAPIAVTPVPHFPDVVEPSHEIQQISQQPEPVQQFQPQIPQQSIPQPSFPSQDVSQQQFDDSDSVSIDNPEISVRTSAPPQPTRQSLLSPLYRSQVPQFPRAEAPLPQFSEGPLPEQQRSEGLPSFSRSRVTQYLEPEQLPPQTRNQTPLPRVQPTARPETTESRQQEPDFSFIRNQLPAFNQGPVISQRQGPNTQTQSQVEFESQSFGSEPVIPSLRNLSPEQSRANQARLLDLLTARGPVSEVRSASEPIRGRVISATPAPSGAEPTDEKVNTRRIVVNRPIQTVQEFDVVEPFTKLERVAVNHPAVVKTAHVELAAFPAVHAVHTAVPAAVTPAPYYIK